MNFVTRNQVDAIGLTCLLLLVSGASAHSSTKATRVVTTKSSTSTSRNIELPVGGNNNSSSSSNTGIIPVDSVARSAERKLALISDRISQLEGRIIEDHHGSALDDDVEIVNSSSANHETHQQVNARPSESDDNSSSDQWSPESSNQQASNQQEFIKNNNNNNNGDSDRGAASDDSLSNFSDSESSSSQQSANSDQDNQKTGDRSSSSTNNTSADQAANTDNNDNKEDPSQQAASFIQPDWSSQLDPSYFAELNAKNHDSRQQQQQSVAATISPTTTTTTTPSTTSSNSYTDLRSSSSTPSSSSVPLLSQASATPLDSIQQQYNKNNRFNRNNMSIISSNSDLVKSYSSVQRLNKAPSASGAGSTSYYSPNYGKSTKRSSASSSTATSSSSNGRFGGPTKSAGQANDVSELSMTSSATSNSEAKVSYVQPPSSSNQANDNNQDGQGAASTGSSGKHQSVVHRSTTGGASNVISRYSQPLHTSSSDNYHDHMDSDSVSVSASSSGGSDSNLDDSTGSTGSSTASASNQPNGSSGSMVSNGHLNGYNNDNPSLYSLSSNSYTTGSHQQTQQQLPNQQRHYQDITTPGQSYSDSASGSSKPSKSLNQRSSLYDSDYSHLSSSSHGMGNIDNSHENSNININNNNNNNEATYKQHPSLSTGYISGIDDDLANKLSSTTNGDDGAGSQQHANNRNQLIPVSQPFTTGPTYSISSGNGYSSTGQSRPSYYSSSSQNTQLPAMSYSSTGSVDPNQMIMHHRTSSEQQLYGQQRPVAHQNQHQHQQQQQQSEIVDVANGSGKSRSKSNQQNVDNVYSRDELYNGYVNGQASGNNNNQISLDIANNGLGGGGGGGGGSGSDGKYYYSLNGSPDQNIASTIDVISGDRLGTTRQQSTTSASGLANQMMPSGSAQIFYAPTSSGDSYGGALLGGQEESLTTRQRSAGSYRRQQQQYLDMINQHQEQQQQQIQMSNNRQANGNNLYAENDLLDSSGATSATGYTSPTSASSQQQQQQQYGQQSSLGVSPIAYGNVYSSQGTGTKQISGQDQGHSSATMQMYSNFYNNNNNQAETASNDQRAQSSQEVPFRRSYVNPNVFRFEPATAGVGPASRYYYAAPTGLATSYLSPATLQALAVAQQGSHPPTAIYATPYVATSPAQVAIAPGDYASAALGSAASQYLDSEPAESSLDATNMDQSFYATGLQPQQQQQQATLSASASSTNDNGNPQASTTTSRNLASWSNIGTLLLGSLPFGMLIAALWPVMANVGRKKRELGLPKDFTELLKLKSPSKILSALIQEAATINQGKQQQQHHNGLNRKRYLKGPSSLFSRSPFKAFHHPTTIDTATNSTTISNPSHTMMMQAASNLTVTKGASDSSSGVSDGVMKDIVNSLQQHNDNKDLADIKDNIMIITDNHKVPNQDRPKSFKLVTAISPEVQTNKDTNIGIKTKAKKALSVISNLLEAASKLRRRHRSSHGNAAWNIISSPIVNFNEQSKLRSAVDQTFTAISSKLNGSQIFNQTNSLLLAIAKHIHNKQQQKQKSNNLSDLSMSTKLTPSLGDSLDLDTSASNLRLFEDLPDEKFMTYKSQNREVNTQASSGTTKSPNLVVKPATSRKIVRTSDLVTINNPGAERAHNSTARFDAILDEHTKTRLDTCLDQFFCRLVVKLNIKGNENIQELKRAKTGKVNSSTNHDQQVKNIKQQQERLAKKYIRELMERISSRYPFTKKDNNKSSRIDDLFRSASEEQCLASYSCGELVQLEQLLTKMNLTITR